MKKETNIIVKKSNTLIEAHYTLGINEQKIIYKLLSLIKVSDEDFKTYEVKISDLISFLNVKNDRIYQDIRQYNRNLQKNIITIVNENGTIETDITWLSSAKYDKEKSTITYKFDSTLKLYLLKLNEHFTQFGIENIMKFNSKYSPRIYELLIKNKFKKYKEREIKIDELRKILVLGDMYEKYGMFKKHIILKTQEEINKYTDITFTFEEIKESRKVVAIIFYIKLKKINKEDVIDLISNDVIELKELFNKKYTANIQNEFIVELIDKKGIATVKECIEVFDQYVKNASEIEKVFRDFTLKYGTDKAYTKTTSYKQKPPQASNYEQRKYDDDYFDSLYDNIEYIK